MSNNPYVMLGIPETATTEQIMDGLERQIGRFCLDNSADAKYLQTSFFHSAKQLLNPEERAKIDEELKKEKKGVEKEDLQSLDNFKKKKSDVFNKKGSVSIIIENKKMIYFNTTLLSSLPTSHFRIGDEEVKLSLLYAFLEENGRFWFTYYESSRSNRWDKVYFYKNIYANKACSELDPKSPNILKDGNILDDGFVKSICLLGRKFIPGNKVRKGEKIAIADLINISQKLSYYFSSNPQVVQEIFHSKGQISVFVNTENTGDAKISNISERKPISVITENNNIIYLNTDTTLKLLEKYPNRGDQKISLADIYAILGEDNSFYFIYISRDFINNRQKSCEVYDYKMVLPYESGLNNTVTFTSFRDGAMFESNGKNFICLLGNRFIPAEMSGSDVISLSNLKNVCYNLSRYFQSNPQIVQSIFGQKEDGNYKIYYAQPSHK